MKGAVNSMEVRIEMLILTFFNIKMADSNRFRQHLFSRITYCMVQEIKEVICSGVPNN